MFALCFVLCMLPQARAASHTDPYVPTGEPGPAAIDMREGAHPPSLAGHRDGPSHVPQSLAEGLGFQIPSIVLRYSRSHVVNLQWWDPGINTSLWCRMIQDDCFLAFMSLRPPRSLPQISCYWVRFPHGSWQLWLCRFLFPCSAHMSPASWSCLLVEFRILTSDKPLQPCGRQEAKYTWVTTLCRCQRIPSLPPVLACLFGSAGPIEGDYGSDLSSRSFPHRGA